MKINLNKCLLCYVAKMKRGFTYYIQDKSDKSLVYYGSSELPTLKDRLDIHIQNFNSWKNGKTNYCSSFKILELNNYEYDVIEVVYFDTKYELREYERPLIEGQVCVNERIPNRSDAEWREVNREHIKEQNAEYYQNNKDKIREQHADYYQNNKEKLKEQQAEWLEANPNYTADYYQNNKKKLKEKFVCPCGGKYTHHHKTHHTKTKIHQDWLKSSNTKTI